MVSISNQIESLYREKSRADMNECLRDLVEDMAITDILTPERLSLELAMLVALLHNNIGTEVGKCSKNVLIMFHGQAELILL